MQALLDVIAPVFIVIGFGYVAVWRTWLTDNAIDALMRFAQNFAVPVLLFRAISTLDLQQDFNIPMLAGFYAGALSGFIAAMLGARLLFRRPWADSIAIGFVGLFSNSVLLGLAITERAYGPDALAANFTIIALHSPFCYAVGITAMEILRNSGQGPGKTVTATLRAMFRNVLVVAIALGFIVNLAGVVLPAPLTDALDMIRRAALPTALFAMGGILFRYRPAGDLRIILYVVAISLILHPAITWALGTTFDLSTAALRSSVLTAAMAPGVNVYIFANMYGVARRVAASAVLAGTALSIITVWGWLAVLG
jgi:predicted permease